MRGCPRLALLIKARPRIQCEDVRVVKELASRSNGAILKGSNPFPRKHFRLFSSTGRASALYVQSHTSKLKVLGSTPRGGKQSFFMDVLHL